MKKNFLFGLLAMMLAWFWFGGVSMADAVVSNCEWVVIDGEWKTVVSNEGDFEKSLQCNEVKEINLNSDIVISKEIVSTNYDNELTINLNSYNITSVVREWEHAWKHFYIELRWNFKIKWWENSKIALRFLDVYWTLVLISWTIESTDWELETNAWWAWIWINQWGKVEIKWWKVEWKWVYAIYNEGTLSIDWWEITSNYYTICNKGTLSIGWWTLSTNNKNWNVIDNILWNIVMKGWIIEWGDTWIFIQWDWSDNSASLSIQWWEIKNQRSFGISWNWTYKEWDKRGWTKIEISDVEIDCTHGGDWCLAIYHPQDWTLDISWWKFKWQDSAIEIRAGKLNILGWTFETDAKDVTYWHNWNWNSVHGAAIAVSQHTTYLPIEVNISDWTFVWNTAFIQVDPEYDANTTTTVETKITWWTFEGEVSIVKNENDNSDNKSLAINWWIYSALPEWLFTVPEWKYLKEQENWKYRLADQTEISQIEVSWVTKPVAWATPTTEWITLNEWLTLTSDETTKPTWKEWDSDITTFEANKTYTLTIPYTLNNSHKWADTVSVAWNDAKTAVKTSDTLLTLTYESAAWYTVTWKNWETVVETDTDVVINSKPEFNWSTPTKQADNSYTYSFKGWSKDWTDATVTLADEKITSDVTYTAVFNQTSKPTYSWGGGGSSRSSSKTTTTDDTKKAEDTSKTDETKSDESKADESKTDEAKTSEEAKAAADAQALKDGYSQEFIDAYNFARENNITTKDTIREADMDAPLTRIAMAKMLSQYAINVLGKTPDTSVVVPTFPDVDAKLDADYNNWVTLAYQLWIMWIGIEKFRPFDLVTRAEFGTALSRMLFGLEDGEWNEWYSTHLAKLIEEKIITNDNPNLKELRGYVMIMLMRSAK